MVVDMMRRRIMASHLEASTVVSKEMITAIIRTGIAIATSRQELETDLSTLAIPRPSQNGLLSIGVVEIARRLGVVTRRVLLHAVRPPRIRRNRW
jgi:hypothetical protein